MNLDDSTSENAVLKYLPGLFCTHMYVIGKRHLSRMILMVGEKNGTPIHVHHLQDHLVGHSVSFCVNRSHEELSCQVFQQIVDEKDLIGNNHLTEEEVERVKDMILAGRKGKSPITTFPAVPLILLM